MKKVKQVNGLIIAKLSMKEWEEEGYEYQVFTKDEYSYGAGIRRPEWECDSLQEAIEWCQS